MERLEKTLGIVLLVTLLSLIGVLLVQSLSPEKSEEIYSVSVLVDALSDHCRLGMEKAALDYNLDVHYVSGYGKSAAQQAEYLQREIENGVDAVILSAPDADYLSTWLENAHVSVPIIAIGEKPLSSTITSYVSPDNVALGRMLAEEMLQAPPSYPCLVLLEFDSSPRIKERLEGLSAAFREAGRSFECRFVERDAESMASLMRDRRASCIAVLDGSLLGALCEGCRFYDMLYGIGYRSELRTELENERLRSLIVYSGFEEGYISMMHAAQATQTPNIEDFTLKGLPVNKSNMYESPQQQILFPIS